MAREALHLTRAELERFRDNRAGAEEKQRALEHLVTGCSDCRRTARKVFYPGAGADYSRVFRNVNAAFVAAQADVREERRRGAEQWRLLEQLDPTQRLLWVKNDPRLHFWGLHGRLLEESRAALQRDPDEATGLAHLAWMISRRLSPGIYGQARVRDFQGIALVALANGRRLSGDLRGAQEDLDQAEELLARGTGNLLEKAHLLSVRASLKTDLGFFEEAGALLRRAAACARQIGDRHLEGKYLIAWSSSIGWIEPERGIELARRGQALLAPGEDSHLELGARHLQALWSNELGQTEEARRILESCRPLYGSFKDPNTRGRLLRLEGLLARNEGNLAEAEDRFSRLMDLYERHNFHFDLALSALELAEVLCLEGRVAESADLLGRLYPVLESWELHGDILRSWLVLQEALRRNAVQETMFRELIGVLRRNWSRRS